MSAAQSLTPVTNHPLNGNVLPNTGATTHNAASLINKKAQIGTANTTPAKKSPYQATSVKEDSQNKHQKMTKLLDDTRGNKNKSKDAKTNLQSEEKKNEEYLSVKLTGNELRWIKELTRRGQLPFDSKHESLQCYHKLHQDLKDMAKEGSELDAIEEAISKEIENSKMQLRDAVQEAMECEELKFGYESSVHNDMELMKMRNSLNINFIHLSNLDRDRFSNQQRDELKEAILEKLDKSCIPNFTSESQVAPDYRRIVPQEQTSIIKPCLAKDQGSTSLDNSYIADICDFQKNPPPHIITTLCNGEYYFSKFPSIYHTEFDFKPVNTNFLLLSRLEFMTKHRRIFDYLYKQYHKRNYEINLVQKMYHDAQQNWLQRVEYVRKEVDRGLKQKYPKIYDELEFEPKTTIKLAQIQTGQQPFMGLGAGQHRNQQHVVEEEEEWDDLQRYRDNRATLKQNRFCVYHRVGARDQQVIYYESRPQLINDPIAYEAEHRRRNVWSVRDIENFLQNLLENPKNFWVVGKLMQHKTSKELIYFYQAFKKLFNLKKHFKTCGVLMTLPTQVVRKQAIQDIINEVMRPIYKYQQLQSSNSLKNSGAYDINQGVSQASSGPNQSFFTVEELLQIYTAQSECRRKAKDFDKYIQNQKINHSIGLYPLGTQKAKPNRPPRDNNLLPKLPYFDEVEKRGNQILEIYQQKCRLLEQSQVHQAQSFSPKFYNFLKNCAQALKIHQNYMSQTLQQKGIQQSLQAKTPRETMLKKR